MEEQDNIVDSMNQLLNGEYMAVDAFNIYISKLEDNDFRETFQDVQKRHRDNIETLADYIQGLGGKPRENTGIKGMLADMKVNLRANDHSSPLMILNDIIEAEKKGIQMGEQVLRGNLDENARKLSEEILDKDRQSVERLEELVHH